MRWVGIAVCALALGGCEKLMRNMYEGARVKPLQARSDARVPEGAVERATQQRLAVERAAAIPFPMTAALLARGRQRFEIYCAPCHSDLGDGDGIIARRGFPHPPSFHDARLRDAPDRHFYDVMTQGHGVMYSYADRVSPEDRWAIVAYIRALQLSQHAPTVVSAKRRAP